MKYQITTLIKYLLFGFFNLFYYNINAQITTSENTLQSNNISKHSISIEAAGRTVLFGSLNYEYRLTERLSLGSGLGVISIGSGEITRSNNGISETGNYFDFASTQMLYGNYFMGKNKHKIYLTTGITHFSSISRSNYPSETLFFNESQFELNTGLGYQYSKNNVFLRLTAYLISMPEPSGWFPELLPWVGLSVGYRL